MRIIVPVFAGVAAAFVVYLLSKAVRAVPKEHDERYWVEYGAGLKLLSAVFFPLSAFVTYAAFHASPDQQNLALIIAGCFWLGTIYVAYEFFFVRFSYDGEYIYHQTPLRGWRKIPWSAIQEVVYSPGTQAFTVKTNGFGNLSVSPYANGHATFIARAEIQVRQYHHLHETSRPNS